MRRVSRQRVRGRPWGAPAISRQPLRAIRRRVGERSGLRFGYSRGERGGERAMAEAVSGKTIAAGAVLFAAGAWLLSVFTGGALAAPRVALVIGNASYEHTAALRNPKSSLDAVGVVAVGLVEQ